MPGDKFYFSALWHRICDQVRTRSHGLCEVVGCGAPGKVFDHIVGRRAGGADHPDNVRHLCRMHDNQVKENSKGVRANGGVLTVPGCDASGRPVDPGHWWNAKP